MPSKSPAQARLMAAVAHGWHPPASSGINVPMKVAKEFNQADKGTGVLEGITKNKKKMGRLESMTK